jgi:hypothetical protein
MEVRVLISLAYVLIFILGVLAITRLSVRHLGLAMFSFVLLTLFAMLNARFVVIDEKVASFISYRIWLGEANTLTFKLQYWLSLPAFNASGDPYAAHGVNIAVQALCFLLAMRFILTTQAPTVIIVALILFPSYYHYSIFGLRDPYINLLCTLFVILAIQDDLKKLIVGGILLGILAVFARPEFAIILMSLVALRIFQRMTPAQKILSVIGYLAAAYVGLLYMPLAFGLVPRGDVSANIEQLVGFNEARQERRLGGDGGGSGSHILGGALYTLPFFLRYPVQLVASFVAPLPHEISGIMQVLGFVESMLFCAVTFLAWRNSRHSDVARYLFWCGFFYMALQAVFAINYGNLLRMRYPAYIFFIGAWAVGVISYKKQLTLAEKEVPPDTGTTAQTT